jgi:hypothetical protein
MTRLPTLPNPMGAVAGVASGVAALVVAALLVPAPKHPDPIDPVGTWDVPAFAFTPTNNSVANNASIDGGEMTIEREAGCRSDACNLVITTGPDLVAGVVLRPQNGRSRYVGDEVLANPNCNGVDAPLELTRGRFVAEAGSGSDTLALVIESELTDPWHGCDPFAFRYEATAARSATYAVTADLGGNVALAWATRAR